MPCYRIGGLTVAADMELPGVAEVTIPAGTEQVRVRQRPVPEALLNATTRGAIWEMDESQFLLRLPGIGRFLVDGGHTLDVETAPGTDPADAMPFVLGTAFGALLHQRGRFVLHASSVASDGLAYAICGPSGIGKSTLAAALCRAGCRFVSDDVSVIELTETGRPLLWPDGRRLKLFAESIELFDLAAAQRGAVRCRVGKHYVDPPNSAIESAAPLAGIYILQDQVSPLQGGIERLPILEAAQELLNQSYRPGLVLAMRKQGNQAPMTMAILRHVPVFRLRRPRDPDRLPEVVDQLQSFWKGTAV